MSGANRHWGGLDRESRPINERFGVSVKYQIYKNAMWTAGAADLPNTSSSSQSRPVAKF